MSSNKYVENVGCKECGSSDAVGVYERPDGSFFGKCFACEAVINDIYSTLESSNNSSSSPSDKEPVEKYSYYDGSYNYLETRGIRKDICEKYEVKSIVDETGRDIVHFYPVVAKSGELAVCMRKVDDKKFRWINGQKDLQFFGQGVVGSGGKMVIITEGVLDCLAAFQMLRDQGKSYRVVSVNNGAKSLVRTARDNYDWLMSFENIFLCMDQDEPGQSVVEEFSALFPPNKVKNITFANYKDPNELLLSGKSHEFLSAIYSAKEARPEGIVSVQDLWDEAIKPPVHGNPFPWKTLTEATFGWRWGEVWGIGAGSGCGKTEFFKETISFTINELKEKAFVIFLEEPAAKTLKVLAGKKANKRFHVPSDKGGNWTVDELKEGIRDLDGKVFLYNHFGSKDWDSLKAKIRYAVVALGTRVIFLDHLTALVAQEENEYKALNRIMEEMSSLCEELGCTIFYVSHLRKASGTPHEEGGRVTADQFKGSGAIVFWSHFLIGLERDQQAEDEDTRNTTTLRVLKDRNTGLATGLTFKLKYNHETGRWGELDEDEYDEEF
jgi:twinkle protein